MINREIEQTLESRRKAVRYVTLDLSALHGIAQVLEEEAGKALKTYLQELAGVAQGRDISDNGKKDLERRIRPDFNITFSDGSSFSGQQATLFTSEAITEDNVERVSMNWHDYDWRSRIELHLTTGNSNYSELVVTGSDGIWVNGVVGKLTHMIEASANGHEWLRGWLYVPITLALGVALWSLVRVIMLIPSFPNSMVTESGQTIFLGDSIGVGVAFVAAPFLALYLLGWLQDTFPSVELRTGLRRNSIEKRRATLKFIAGAIILPIVVNLVSMYFAGAWS